MAEAICAIIDASRLGHRDEAVSKCRKNLDTYNVRRGQDDPQITDQRLCDTCRLVKKEHPAYLGPYLLDNHELGCAGKPRVHFKFNMIRLDQSG